MSRLALRIFSPTHGLLSEEIKSTEVKSREDARKIGPFCNSDNKLVYWVNWSTRSDKKKIRPYFRRYSDHDRSLTHLHKHIAKEKIEIDRQKSTDIHQKIQNILLGAMEKLIKAGQPMPWYFKDERSTDFSLSGNLLSGVETVQKEYRIRPPFFNNEYRLDIALLGPKIYRKNIILGAVEIEYTHEVDLVKTLLCKALGFPLFTLNVADIDPELITEEWCIERLTETRESSIDGRRRNYVFIHNMLYPVYISGYDDWGMGDKQQYVIFVKEDEIQNLSKTINFLKSSLNLSDDEVKLTPVNKNNNDRGSISMFENEGAIAGDNWADYNSERFLRLVMKRPYSKEGGLYYFYLALTQLLTLHTNCIVGYKHDIGYTNPKKFDPFWYASKTKLNPEPPPKFLFPSKRFCIKRISEPIGEIMKYLSSRTF